MTTIFLTVFLLPAVIVHAQVKGFSLGPYMEAAQPAGNFSKTNKNGFGAGFGADIRLGKIGLTGSAGYMHFSGKTINKGNDLVKMPAVKAFPVRVGFKYRMAPFIYAKLESGLAKFTGGNESSVIISPGIAARILGIELQAKYEVWKNDETNSFWGLKAAFNF